MERRNWTREELVVAFNLYCKIPFSKINYKHLQIIQLANIIGRTPSAVAWKLVNFASLDHSLQARGIAGAKNTGKLDKEIFDEFTNNWSDLGYESEMLFSKYFKEDLLPMKEQYIDDEEEIYQIREGQVKETVVKVRVKQSFFRKAVLSSYENKCCITGIEISELLVASHIIPWSKDEKNRLNPQNGICLNSIHDKAFDRGLITIDKDFRIIVSPKIKNMYNESMKTFFYNFEGKTITLPKKFIPDEEFIFYHNNNIFQR